MSKNMLKYFFPMIFPLWRLGLLILIMHKFKNKYYRITEKLPDSNQISDTTLTWIDFEIFF